MRVGVIGLGPMGKRHGEAARLAGCELAGVADMDAQRLAAAGAELALPPEVLFSSAQELLQQGVECVVIATTAPSHCDLTELAARAGAKTILCEKPMATSLEECDRMLRVCEEHDVRLAINHQLRFLPPYIAAKEKLASAEMGGMKSVVVTAGNFGLAMVGTHMFELLRFLTDEEPVSVTAWFSPERVANPRGAQFEDRAGSVRVETTGGKRLYIEAGADQGHGVRVLCSASYGQLLVDPLEGTVEWWHRRAEDRALPTTRYGMPSESARITTGTAGPVDASAAVLRALFAGHGYPSGEDGRLALRTLIAAHLSVERGNVPVTLAETASVQERRFRWA